MTTQYAPAWRWGSYSLESLIGAVAVLCSTGAAAIHFAVIGDHFNESWLYGTFFAVVAWLQVVWALALLRQPSKSLYWAGAAGNAAIIAMWLITRTLGVPAGPSAGEVEAAGIADLFATLFEAVIILTGVIVPLRGARRDEGRPIAGYWFAVGVAAIFVSVTTTFSLVDLASGEQAASGHAVSSAVDTGGNNGQ